ncbi:unnamed protein product [Paramecium octaurelia]|uniref:Transmembrane protein n=1 Tax=Paramecium octaurelia TaxID=43137 RepID=A0A8S1W854_PAROT|nr:unnamed protein product [Paramecium octaurelia]
MIRKNEGRLQTFKEIREKGETKCNQQRILEVNDEFFNIALIQLILPLLFFHFFNPKIFSIYEGIDSIIEMIQICLHLLADYIHFIAVNILSNQLEQYLCQIFLYTLIWAIRISVVILIQMVLLLMILLVVKIFVKMEFFAKYLIGYLNVKQANQVVINAILVILEHLNKRMAKFTNAMNQIGIVMKLDNKQNLMLQTKIIFIIIQYALYAIQDSIMKIQVKDAQVIFFQFIQHLIICILIVSFLINQEQSVLLVRHGTLYNKTAHANLFNAISNVKLVWILIQVFVQLVISVQIEQWIMVLSLLIIKILQILTKNIKQQTCRCLPNFGLKERNCIPCTEGCCQECEQTDFYKCKSCKT